MPALLASLVAQANIARLSLIGLAKNAGKTTATNHLFAALIEEGYYKPEQLGITSLGLDGEATDAMTGLPKPRYLPDAGMLIATAETLLRQAEGKGAMVERLRTLPGRSALGKVVLARVTSGGEIVIAGPTLLRDMRATLDQMQAEGARLGIIDGAINRLGAAAPAITDACILCTGASVAATPFQVARRTLDVLFRLRVEQSAWADAYKKATISHRLALFTAERRETLVPAFHAAVELADEVRWMLEMASTQQLAIFFLHGAFTEELARKLLDALYRDNSSHSPVEIVVEDSTKIFCHAAALRRLAERNWHVQVVTPLRVLALTINPYTPEYQCSSPQLLDQLLKIEPEITLPPIVDVISGLTYP